MRNLLTILFATTLLGSAAIAQSHATDGVVTATGSTITTKDGSPVLTTSMEQTEAAPVAKPVEPKQAKKHSKKHRAKKAATKAAKTAEEPAKVVH